MLHKVKLCRFEKAKLCQFEKAKLCPFEMVKLCWFEMANLCQFGMVNLCQFKNEQMCRLTGKPMLVKTILSKEWLKLAFFYKRAARSPSRDIESVHSNTCMIQKGNKHVVGKVR